MANDNDWQTLQNEVREQHILFDKKVSGYIADYSSTGKRIHCSKGCRECCNLAVNCTYTEALCLAAILTDEQTERIKLHAAKLLLHMDAVYDMKSYLKMHRQVIGFCPLLLEDGACGAYDHRPLSCRSLLSTMESRWCGMDFSRLSSAEKAAFVESLDRRSVAFPMHYLAGSQNLGQQLEAQAALAMAVHFGFTISGNLPFLLFLEKEHGFSKIMSQGHAASLDFLQRAGLLYPFLIVVEKL